MIDRDFTFILSAPRSGSSCTAGCLQLCGMNLGSKLLKKDQWNEKGYFENLSVYRFNRKTLKAVNVSVKDPPRWLVGLKKLRLLDFADRLEDVVRSSFLGKGPFLIKDPRLLVMWPLYTSVFQRRKVIFLYREAHECALSMSKFPAFGGSLKRCMDLYDKYSALIDIVRRMESANSIAVDFSNLTKYPEREIDRLCSFVGLVFDEYKRRAVRQFVDRSLVHGI